VRFTRSITLLLTLGVVMLATAPALAQETGTLRRPDVIYVPTPPDVVAAMLKVAKVGPKDVVYDLGCGDGRIVVAAVKDFSARSGVGIDIDPERIREAEANAKTNGVNGLIKFRNEDLFEANISEASVVTLYLLPSLNLKLRPKLWNDLKVGTRIVSHAFDMGDWTPEQELEVDGRRVFFWTITEDVKKKAAQGGQ